MMILSAASSSISLTTPASPGEELARNTKLDNIKRWGQAIIYLSNLIYLSIYLSISRWTISTYKCGRQSLYERLGKTSRTVDPELEEQIEVLPTLDISNIYYLSISRCCETHSASTPTFSDSPRLWVGTSSTWFRHRYGYIIYCNPGVLCLVGLRLTEVMAIYSLWNTKSERHLYSAGSLVS